MSKKHVVVIGGNFAGMSAALELKHLLSNDVAITVMSRAEASS
jgi:NADH dehydrogenase FAD-containing subunit